MFIPYAILMYVLAVNNTNKSKGVRFADHLNINIVEDDYVQTCHFLPGMTCPGLQSALSWHQQSIHGKASAINLLSVPISTISHAIMPLGFLLSRNLSLFTYQKLVFLLAKQIQETSTVHWGHKK